MRINAVGVTTSALEDAVGLSRGYLSKVRHGAVNGGEQLRILLSLLARHPLLLRELGVTPKLRRAPPLRPPGERGALRFLLTIAPELDARSTRWALAGATALAAHGVVRATKDVDIFVDDEDRHVLQLFRERGAAVGKVASSTFVVVPRGVRSAEDHLDVIFPAQKSVRAAIGRAPKLKVQAVRLPVLSALDLCVTKLMSHSERDHEDARLLMMRGLASKRAVREALASVPRLPPSASLYVRARFDRALAEARLG
jgi:hypothetical protein